MLDADAVPLVAEKSVKAKRVVLRDDSDSDSSDSDSDSSSSSDSDEGDVKAKVQQRPVPQDVVEDGDFDRLVENIRAGNSEGNAPDGSMLAREWDFVVQETTDAYPRSKKDPRTFGPILSAHIRNLLGEGNQAYVDGDLQNAIRIMLEVIRIEPRAPSAWAVLAQCYDEQKQLAKGLQLRIMGAHLRQDAEEWDRLARQSKEFGYPQQALYCWQKGYQVDPTNVAALWDCAMLAQSVDDIRTTRFAFLGILARFPHDLYILSLLRPVLIALSDLQTCANLYNAAFEHHRMLYPSGAGPCTTTTTADNKPSEHIPGGGFGQMEVLVLADLYNALAEHERAVEVVRRGMRWLQGRAEESWWDLCTDDREYDPAPESGEAARVIRVLDAVNDVEAGHYALDINSRHRLAFARLKMGDIEEGQMHAGMILAEEMLDYAPLFSEIADAYFEVDMFPEAREIYERLGSSEITSSVHILTRTAVCMRSMNDLRGAAEVYEAVRKADSNNNQMKMELAEIYEILDEPRKALDLVYEVMDSRRRRPRDNGPADPTDANRLPPLIQEKQKPPPPKTMSQMKRLNKPPRLTPQELRALEETKETEAMVSYRRVRELWDAMVRGEDEDTEEWLGEAKKLIEAFRETRRLFSTSRGSLGDKVYRGMFPIRRTRKRMREEEQEEEENHMANRLQLDIAHQANARQTKSSAKYDTSDVFRGIKCEEWLELFFQYSVVLTRRGAYDEGEEVLRHLLMSSAYQQPVFQDRIRLALMAIAASVGRFPVVVEQARKIHTAHQFHNEPLRLMVAALCRSATCGADAFLNAAFQKYLHREMLLADATAHRPAEVVWSASHRRFSINSATGEDVALCSEDEQEQEQESVGLENKRKEKQRLPQVCRVTNPVIPAIYGLISLAAKSYQSAIYYLLMAHDYCPEDPLISLSLTAASLGRASQRQCDNRHHLVAQAMAFLTRYREYRVLTVGEHTSEIEYNVGRTFHHLGLYSHAVRHYERAIQTADAMNLGSCAEEAAYNLSLIFVATGARQRAVELTRRWLSI
ncbi:hypothetical protein C8F01DRAFT_994021 [Mycena amicta]|nr:hypothetical protein C8F01DRAFT_994021 [Mycena amicta]